MAQTTARIRLVTRGDDSGSCNTANVAIWNAYKKGILRNTSIMVPAPAFPEAAEMFSEDRGLCVGLHVTLNAEWDSVRWGPVLGPEKVPSIVDAQGHLFKTTQALSDNHPKLGEMLAEVQAQLDLARSSGLDIRYMDTHMGVSWVGGPKQPLEGLAEREGLVYRPAAGHLPRLEGDFANPVEALIARLDTAEPGTYIIVGHPCYDRVDVRMFAHAGLEESQGVARDWQRRIFMDRRVLDYCREGGVEPIRYDEI
jgi:predicted glycoside hydrolase/deacetylase ChbG (UPF0249 family)